MKTIVDWIDFFMGKQNTCSDLNGSLHVCKEVVSVVFFHQLLILAMSLILVDFHLAYNEDEILV